MALVSNIFVGLTPYATGSFTAGQRCSSAGNAYQCTVSGTSTAAPTGTGAFINNGGTAVFKWLAAISATTLQAWANGIPATLTQPVIGLVWNCGPITPAGGTPLLTLTGHTTSASNNITLSTAPGEGFRDALVLSGGALAFNSSNGVSIVLPGTAGGVNYIVIGDANVVFSGLQIQDPNPTSVSTIVQTTQTVLFDGCIIDGFSQSGGAFMIEGVLSGPSSSTLGITNCLIVDRGAGDAFQITVQSNYKLVLANNTVRYLGGGTQQIGFLDKGGATVASTAKNVIFGGFPAGTTVGSDTGALWNVSFCLADSATISGTGITLGSGNVFSASMASQFVSATTNFRLKIGSGAINAGTTDTADIPASIDILGTPRPQATAWDIGAYEFPVAIAAGTAAGGSSASAVGIAIKRSTGTAAGGSTASGVSTVALSVGTASGGSTASGIGRSTRVATGTAVGGSTALARTGSGALIQSVIQIDPIPSQRVGSGFTVSGTVTLVASLQFSDDGGTAFTNVVGQITPLGTVGFSFQHPGLTAPGAYTLTIQDTSTGSTAATSYFVLADASPVAFPPAGPTTLLRQIPSYLYQEYYDDDDLQALVASYNGLAQEYLDWFNTINLPVYPSPTVSGDLLDWVAAGLYGLARPTIAVTNSTSIGDFNTYALNTTLFNASRSIGSSTIFPVTDEVFKRIITWSFYKNDGKTFTVRWLKRRVIRFLGGVGGADCDTSATQQVSVTFPSAGDVQIAISAGLIPTTYAPVFQAAVLSGVIPMPFQYSFSVLLT